MRNKLLELDQGDPGMHGSKSSSRFAWSYMERHHRRRVSELVILETSPTPPPCLSRHALGETQAKGKTIDPKGPNLLSPTLPDICRRHMT